MSNETGGRQTVAQVAVQQGHLEGRVTGLERDVQNMTRAVDTLSSTVKDGFEQSISRMEAVDKKHASRVGEIHERLDAQIEKSSERGRPNWGVVVASVSLVWAIVLALVAWGMTQSTRTAVAHVRSEIQAKQIDALDDTLQREMRLLDENAQIAVEALDTRLQQEMRLLQAADVGRREAAIERLTELCAHVDEHIKLGGHSEALVKHAAAAEKMRAHELELIGLRSSTNILIQEQVDHAKQSGYNQAQIDALYDSLGAKTEDRFFGREGAAFDARLLEIEKFVREKLPPAEK